MKFISKYKKITFLVSSILIVLIASFFISDARVSADLGAQDIFGWAWSDNIGWISFNGSDSGAGGNYKVTIDDTNGNFSGYAWSDNIGWISFNSADVSGCPSGSCQANVNLTLGGTVTGWAKALSADGNGWDGWISMSKPSANFYKCSLDNLNYATAGQCSSACNNAPVSCVQGNVLSGTTDNDDYFYGVSATENTITFLNNSEEFIPNSISLINFTALGNFYGNSPSSRIGKVSASDNKISFFNGGGAYIGEIILSGATASGEVIAGGVGFDKAVGSGNTLNFYKGSVNKGAIEITVDSSESYSCPLGNYTCSGSPKTCAIPGVCTATPAIDYGVTFNPTTGKFGGYAWGSDVVGWVSFSGSGYAVGINTDPVATQCNDGIDNDGNGVSDLADSGCSGANDITEEPVITQCNDGINNDAGEDLLVDLADYGCDNASDDTESPNPQCSDNVDNADAEDILIDMADPGCTGPTDPSESDIVPSFTLSSVGAMYVTLVTGSPATSNTAKIIVNPLDNFASNVALSIVSITPSNPATNPVIAVNAGSLGDPTLNSGEYGTGSNLSVTVPAGTLKGLYTVAIQGIGGGVTKTINVSLNIESFDPGFEEI